MTRDFVKEKIKAVRTMELERFDQYPKPLKELVHEYGEVALYYYRRAPSPEAARKWCEEDRRMKQEARCAGVIVDAFC